MNGKWLYVGVLAIAMHASVLQAEEAPESSRPMPRNFDRFEFDTGTVDGFWLEVQTFYDSKSGLRALDTPSFQERNGDDVDTVRIESRLVGGTKNVEAGVIIPYVFVEADDDDTHDQSNVGDVRVYLKVVPLRTRWFDAGFGYDISTESGDESEGFGYGAVGHLPFATGTAKLGPVDLNVHFGHRFINNHENNPGESWVYGTSGHFTIFGYLAARVELVGQSFRQNANIDALALEPGIDFSLPLGPVELMLRPTGSVGLTSDTSDWGLGGSFVLRYRTI